MSRTSSTNLTIIGIDLAKRVFTYMVLPLMALFCFAKNYQGPKSCLSSQDNFHAL